MRSVKLFTRTCILLLVFQVTMGRVSLAQSAASEDVASPSAIVAAAYDVISGDAGVPRDWQRFQSLFAPGATLSAVVERDGNVERVIMTPQSYVENSGPQLQANGFHEVGIHQVTEQFGQIAHVFSTYESRRSATDAQPFARGINSFQLMHDGDRWWIVSIYWQAESADNPIPTRYL